MSISTSKKFGFACVLLSLVACATPTASSPAGLSSSAPVTSASSASVFDPSNFPNYVQDVTNAQYSFGEKELEEPFWWSNIIYNETALMVDQDDGTASCSLAFKPVRILSVRDYTWQHEYVEGTDFTVSGQKLVWKEGSSLNHWNMKQLTGLEDFPAPYTKNMDGLSNTTTDYNPWTGSAVYSESPLYYGNQLNVTYAYDAHGIDLDQYPSCQLDKLPHLSSILSTKKDLAITVIGDSVSAGCSASAAFKHDPEMDPFATMIGKTLTRRYGNKVTVTNQSVGGTTSSEGANDTNIKALNDSNPDLVIIHFGINDAGAKHSPYKYYSNIQKTILALQSAHPDTDVVLMSCVAPNPKVYDTDLMANYWIKLGQLSSENSHVVYLDFARAWASFNTAKTYYDATGNGINHPNDWGHRFYNGALLATFVNLHK